MAVIYKTVEVEVEVDVEDCECEVRDIYRREEEMRLYLYSAIYNRNMEKAFETMKMMAMVDIDRDLIWTAKGGSSV